MGHVLHNLYSENWLINAVDMSEFVLADFVELNSRRKFEVNSAELGQFL